MVRCKMVCVSVGRTKWSPSEPKPPLYSVELRAVGSYEKTGDSPEFFASTPTGSAKFESVNQGAGGSFEPGRTYYLDFSPAD